jgi:hypothetical protein
MTVEHFKAFLSSMIDSPRRMKKRLIDRGECRLPP